MIEKTTSNDATKRKGTLLIVEDESDLREVLAEMLEPLAEKIITAENGKIALDLVKSGQVDAVLTDINMPVMSGLQFLAEIRLLCMQIPVVVLTGYADMEATKEALRLDATDLLEKPFEVETVYDVVQKALDYGVALKQMEAEVDELFAGSQLPADKIARLKKSRKVTLGMKMGFSHYVKKS